MTCLLYTSDAADKASNWEHGYSAAMAWAYFLIVAVFLALVVALVNKFVYYEVE